MPFLSTDKMWGVDWASGIYWDVRFANPDPDLGPFTEWFPATEVEENLATMENHTYEFYMSSYEFPLTSKVFDLQVTFIDDVTHAVHEYLAAWINNDILNSDKDTGPYLTPLCDAVRQIELVRLDASKEVIRSASYWVTPEGGINWTGSSAAGPVTNTIRFPIHASVLPDPA